MDAEIGGSGGARQRLLESDFRSCRFDPTRRLTPRGGRRIVRATADAADPSEYSCSIIRGIKEFSWILWYFDVFGSIWSYLIVFGCILWYLVVFGCVL